MQVLEGLTDKCVTVFGLCKYVSEGIRCHDSSQRVRPYCFHGNWLLDEPLADYLS